MVSSGAHNSPRMPLKGLSPLLSPALLETLASMGHGDELVIADANFPSASVAAAQASPHRLIRCDGVESATHVLRAILTVFPLDTFAPNVAVMRQVGDPSKDAAAVQDFLDVIQKSHVEKDACSSASLRVERLERDDFYARAKRCFAVVATGEQRLYGNVILKKGVIDSQGKVVDVMRS